MITVWLLTLWINGAPYYFENGVFAHANFCILAREKVLQESRDITADEIECCEVPVRGS